MMTQNLEEQLRQAIREKKHARRTEEAYLDWYRRFVAFHGQRHPSRLSAAEVNHFLIHLKLQRKAADATLLQAQHALGFFFREILHRDLPELRVTQRVRREKRFPTVLSQEEAQRLLETVTGEAALPSRLIYGTGMRVNEALRLRSQDVDFEEGTLAVRGEDEQVQREVLLPKVLEGALREQLAFNRRLFEADRRECFLPLPMPDHMDGSVALLGQTWEWFWVFPSKHLAHEGGSTKAIRNHLHANSVNRCLREAAKLANIATRPSAAILRHSYALHLLMSGVHLDDLQKALGHRDRRTTEVYRQLMKELRKKLESPLDLFAA
ncbi:MAG: integron integrase [Verrucomicrobiota bacterium]